MKKATKILSVLLALIMCLTFFSIAASAKGVGSDHDRSPRESYQCSSCSDKDERVKSKDKARCSQSVEKAREKSHENAMQRLNDLTHQGC